MILEPCSVEDHVLVRLGKCLLLIFGLKMKFIVVLAQGQFPCKDRTCVGMPNFDEIVQNYTENLSSDVPKYML